MKLNYGLLNIFYNALYYNNMNVENVYQFPDSPSLAIFQVQGEAKVKLITSLSSTMCKICVCDVVLEKCAQGQGKLQVTYFVEFIIRLPIWA